MALILLRRTGFFQCLIICLVVTIAIAFLLGLVPLSSIIDSCDCKPNETKMTGKYTRGNNAKKRLCVIVPFRDRFEELLQFGPHLHKFLYDQNIPHLIYIINQIDKFRFNRASLINVGFLESRSNCDYIAMHDVDLLPINPELSYAFPEHGPFHIASPDLHPIYHYKNFVGGILLINNKHFESVRPVQIFASHLNGMSNKYWGWGMEDDEFYARIRKKSLNLTRPVGITTGSRNTFQHIHDRQKRKRDQGKVYNQREENRRLDMTSGISSVAYKLVNQYNLAIDGTPVQVLNVFLSCNRTATPWCEVVNSQQINKKKTL
uniref:Beta-1,4-N-acetylgalactosaminyltransferase n=1 Tax=Strigamia maritima TaxID=126957 RepID=T1J0Y7_STRMM